MRVRAFRGRKADLERASGAVPIGDICLYFESVVLRPSFDSDNSEVTLSRELSQRWLSPELAEQSHVLVFEPDTAPATPFLLRRTDVSRYFSRGVEIKVHPEGLRPNRVTEELKRASRYYDKHPPPPSPVVAMIDCFTIVERQAANLTLELCGYVVAESSKPR